MNREETLALYEQGVEAWNKWANEMLEERKRLEETGERKDMIDENEEIIPINDRTKKWFSEAEANFSTKENPHTFEDNVKFSEIF